MGHKDLISLHTIYEKIKTICKTNDLPFHFRVDDGDWETAIEFSDGKDYHPPISQSWSNNPTIFCPDLLDYPNRIIIEYEEEIGNKRPGAHLAKKGHNRYGDIANKRDERRNRFYNQRGFRYFQIWEYEKDWQQKLESFLLTMNINNY